MSLGGSGEPVRSGVNYSEAGSFGHIARFLLRAKAAARQAITVAAGDFSIFLKFEEYTCKVSLN